MNPSKPYCQSSTEDLLNRTQYESWVLEAVYDAVNYPVIEDWPDQIIYPASGGCPQKPGPGRGFGVIGDWRPHFIEVGAPLIFVTSYKLIDMLIEWILEHNGQSKPIITFKEKIKWLERELVFPPFIASRDWLRERLIGFYKKLSLPRHTIIHNRYFRSSKGILSISEVSKSGEVGSEIYLSENDLRNFAVMSVSLLKYISGNWIINSFRDKYLRRSLDNLVQFHGLPTLGQQVPRFLTVRIYSSLSDYFEVDLDCIRKDVTRMCREQDVVFDLRVILVSNDGSQTEGFLFQWDEISTEGRCFTREINSIRDHQCPIPEGIDVVKVSRDLQST